MSKRRRNTAPPRGHARAGHSFRPERLMKDLSSGREHSTTGDKYIGRVIVGTQHIASDLMTVGDCQPIVHDGSLVVPLMQRHTKQASRNTNHATLMLPRLRNARTSALQDLQVPTHDIYVKSRSRSQYIVYLTVEQGATAINDLTNECEWLRQYNNQPYSIGPPQDLRIRIAECSTTDAVEQISEAVASLVTLSCITLMPATTCTAPRQQ